MKKSATRYCLATILSLGAFICLGIFIIGTPSTPKTVLAADGIFTDSGQALGNGHSYGVELGDLDNDGDLDAFIANIGILPDTPNRIWLNQGGVQGGEEGQFVDSNQALGEEFSYTAVLGDLDGDGDLDAFVGNGGANTIWLNDGTGVFIKTGQNLGSYATFKVALGDVDGDGDLDAVTANYFNGEPNRIWVNQGGAQSGIAGQFAAGGELGFAEATAVALGDLDNDGDLDAYLGLAGLNQQTDQVWVNNGSGIFSDSGRALGAQNSGDVELADLDGDSDLDAFVVTSFAGGHRVYLNAGGAQGGTLGQLIDSGQILEDGLASFDVSLGDVDSDGDLDAFIANYSGRPNSVLLNDGSGQFTSSDQSLGNSTSVGVALGDVDGDNDLDAFVANASDSGSLDEGAPNRVWLNGAAATPPEEVQFYSTGQFIDTFPTYDVSLGDVDLDGDLDALIGSIPNSSLYVAFNQGNGIFDPNVVTIEIGYFDKVILADWDNDGDLDIFALYPGLGAIFIYFNQGGIQGGLTGEFNITEDVIHIPWREEIALADLDGDSDLDGIVATDGTGTVEKLINDGLGGVESEALSYITEGDKVRLADMDGDGDNDLFLLETNCLNCQSSGHLWLNDGSGQFVETATYNGNYEHFELADFNGDGAVDAIFASQTELALWTNNGDGALSLAGTIASSYSQEISIGDVDGDGDLDLLSVRLVEYLPDPANANELWLNDGQGVFTLQQQMGLNPSHAVALGDLDGDGDLDAFVGNEDEDHVWLNGNDLGLAEVVVGWGVPFTLDRNGKWSYTQWSLANVPVPVILSVPQTFPVSVTTDIFLEYDPAFISRQNHIFTPGESVVYPSGEVDGELLNPYSTNNPDLGLDSEVELFLREATGAGIKSPEDGIIRFIDPSNGLRDCFFDGIEGLITGNWPFSRVEGSHSILSTVGGSVLPLDLLRDLRDDTMAVSPQGRYYSGLYTAHSPELLQIVSDRPWLITAVADGVLTWTPAIQSLVDGEGDNVTITAEMVGSVVHLADEIMLSASPELQTTIAKEMAVLDPFSFVGLTMDEAWEQVNERPITEIYLPAIFQD